MDDNIIGIEKKLFDCRECGISCYYHIKTLMSEQEMCSRHIKKEDDSVDRDASFYVEWKWFSMIFFVILAIVYILIQYYYG